MAEFNISGSKIEQLNSSGDNYKIAGNTAPVAVTGGDAVQTTGAGNKVEVESAEKPSVWGVLWDKVVAGWRYLFG